MSVMPFGRIIIEKAEYFYSKIYVTIQFTVQFCTDETGAENDCFGDGFVSVACKSKRYRLAGELVCKRQQHVCRNIKYKYEHAGYFRRRLCKKQASQHDDQRNGQAICIVFQNSGTGQLSEIFDRFYTCSAQQISEIYDYGQVLPGIGICLSSKFHQQKIQKIQEYKIFRNKYEQNKFFMSPDVFHKLKIER
jgi:hypothetical protein